MDQHQSHVEWSCVIEVEKNRNLFSRCNNFQLFMLIFHFKSLLSSQISSTQQHKKPYKRPKHRWSVHFTTKELELELTGHIYRCISCLTSIRNDWVRISSISYDTIPFIVSVSHSCRLADGRSNPMFSVKLNLFLYLCRSMALSPLRYSNEVHTITNNSYASINSFAASTSFLSLLIFHFQFHPTLADVLEKQESHLSWKTRISKTNWMFNEYPLRFTDPLIRINTQLIWEISNFHSH